jgi:acyl transferase domain-containing protein/NADPH:quinone reductase-like Zn-dependent oxidoreductase/acyl carrier protein
MLAPDGRCKFGDHRADGFVRSDGVAAVILKPLAEAIADGDPIYAVIAGSAVNNDGQASGLLITPAQAGQEAVLRKAYAAAGIGPQDVDYIEAHGTGTKVGDPVEIGALGSVLKAPGRGRSALLGSIKGNIGHTEAASGVAGLLKVALAMENEEIPPTLHMERRNPDIPWAQLPVEIATEPTPWSSSGRRIAGVSSFGISGTNAHVVLTNPPERAATVESENGRPQLICVSGHTEAALSAQLEAWERWLEAGVPTIAPLADLAFTAAMRRTHHEHRAAFVVPSTQALSEGLAACRRGEARPGVVVGRAQRNRPRTVFIFPGQGSQWVGMGQGLFRRDAAFRKALEDCDTEIHHEAGWSAIEELHRSEDATRQGQVDVVQPLLFAIQVALTALWRSWGVEPDAVIGHSMGEVAAAFVAGSLSLADATRVICRRSRLIAEEAPQGGMLVVGLPENEARSLLEGRETEIAVGVVNGLGTTVLSGDKAALSRISSELESRGVFWRSVNVDYASHSPQMDPLLPELERRLAGLRPRAGAVPLYSTLLSQPLDGHTCDAAYWCRNLRETVRFAAAVQKLKTDGHDLFLEVSPHPILVTPVLESTGALVLSSLRRGEDEFAAMLKSVAELHVRGYPVHHAAIASQTRRCVRLPSYVWGGERYYCDGPEFSIEAPVIGFRAMHPLLGHRTSTPLAKRSWVWQAQLGTQTSPSLQDHRVGTSVVLPGAAYAEAALASARELGLGRTAVENLSFQEALVFDGDGAETTQTVVVRETERRCSFRFFRRQRGTADTVDEWTCHASGTIVASDDPPAGRRSLKEIRTRCEARLEGSDHYAAMERRSLHYGPAFRGISHVHVGEGEALAELASTEAVSAESTAYVIHPALLDTCFQVLLCALRVPDNATYVPTGLRRLRVHRPVVGPLWCHARSPAVENHELGRELNRGAHTNALLGPESENLELSGDLELINAEGELVLSVNGLRAQRLESPRSSRAEQTSNLPLHAIRWVVLEQAVAAAPPSRFVLLQGRNGLGEAARAILEARGARCSVVTLDRAGIDDVQLPDRATTDTVGYVYLLGLDATVRTEAGASYADDSTCSMLLELAQRLVPAGRRGQLWIVTQGAQQALGTEVRLRPEQAPLWGFGRSLVHEHPDLGCRLVDLDPGVEGMGELAKELADELVSADLENQIAIRCGHRLGARLMRIDPHTCSAGAHRNLDHDASFSLEISRPGSLEDVVLRSTARPSLRETEVLIETRAAGLNFIDLLRSLGQYPGQGAGPALLGMECAGRVVAVGEGVTEFKVGEDVIAVSPSTGCSFGRFVGSPSSLVARRPKGLSQEEAAALPIAYLTALYSLRELARLSAGERVLIHSAAGGVGLASVRIAQWLGAKVIATAGTEEKRDLLRSLGVAHVFDSRSLDFANQILKMTNGRGVEVLLNSLSGEALVKGFELLAPFGRFVELGKRDIYEGLRLDLSVFSKSAAMFAVDVDRLLREGPATAGRLLREVVDLIESGELPPLPYQLFDIADAQIAFRRMAEGKHIGKIVLGLPMVRRAGRQKRGEHLCRPDATYLITGGLGALGLAVAQWLVTQGARHLTLVGRRPADDAAQSTIARIEAEGTSVSTFALDVANREQVIRLVAAIQGSGRQVRGVVHAAGVLDDGIVLQLDRTRLDATMGPKIGGAWNLHQLGQEWPLDFFVMFSSAASLFGAPGQANYAAANAFLDGLAHARRAQGLPALSIQWGAWAEIGLAARPDRGGRLETQGAKSIAATDALRSLDQAMRYDVGEVGIFSIDWARWKETYPGSSQLLSTLTVQGESDQETNSTISRAMLLQMPIEHRVEAVTDYLGGALARALGLRGKRLDDDQPLTRFGLDSLMAVTLRNRVAQDTGISIPVSRILQGATIRDLVTFIFSGLEAEGSTRRDGAGAIETTSGVWEEGVL